MRTTRVLVLAGLLAAPFVAVAQAAPVDTNAAREALAKKEGESGTAQELRDTLTAVDKQYSLIRKGQFSITYDGNYSYIARERIVANLSNFGIENQASHTITNTLSGDYGLFNNLTLSAALPLVSKYAIQTGTTDFSGLSHSIGDVTAGARWQPFGIVKDWPSLTASAQVRMPTGRSPFEGVVGTDVASGSGTWGLTLGLNANKISDPVALFGSLNVTASLAATGLDQRRGNLVLTEVLPGMGVSFGFGMAYALSYTVTTSIAFQQSVSAAPRFTFSDGSQRRGSQGTSAIISFGAGYRISPKTTINTTVNFGLTPDSPNFGIAVNIPLNF